jgi:TPR repeat protein
MGFAPAYGRLYVIYIDGLGGKKDGQRALHYLRLSAEQNDPNAWYNLARSYLDGTIERLNKEKALECLVKHALLQYANECKKQPGVEHGLANYLLAQMLQQLGLNR